MKNPANIPIDNTTNIFLNGHSIVISNFGYDYNQYQRILYNDYQIIRYGIILTLYNKK